MYIKSVNKQINRINILIMPENDYLINKFEEINEGYLLIINCKRLPLHAKNHVV